MTTTIAERRYTAADGREIIVRIGRPVPDPPGAWRCTVHVEGIAAEPEDVRGIDAIQAIAIALDYARLTIERSGLAVSWLAGEGTGIPWAVPGYLPEHMQRDIERYISDKVRVFSRP